MYDSIDLNGYSGVKKQLYAQGVGSAGYAIITLYR
jgi:hypothetical protein